MFVIGTYTNIDKGIEVTLNQNHLAFNKRRVSNDFFKKDMLRELDGASIRNKNI